MSKSLNLKKGLREYSKYAVILGPFFIVSGVDFYIESSKYGGENADI